MLPVIFDLDGTLIDSLPTVTGAANALLRELGRPDLEPSVVAGFVGWGEQVFLDRLISTTGLEDEGRSHLMARFMAHYEVAGRDTRLMPGAEAAMRELRAAGVPLGLCTNKPRAALLPVLQTTVLGELLDVVVAGDDLERRKPDPAPLLHILERMAAERCLYVGDTGVDAETAKSAGMPYALFTEGIRTTPVSDIPHDVAFSDFSELPEIWKGLARA